MSLNIHNVSFVKSAASAVDFIRAPRPSVVFAGKSNVGKSSVINRLLCRKSFARVSAQPGKTAHINYFDVDGKVYFVDLPGYGYAKVPDAERRRWSSLMESFFSEKGLISLCVMIVDSRHRPTADDVTMARWFADMGCQVVVAANKCDKLRKSEVEPNLTLIRETLPLPEDTQYILFSAEKGTGRSELLSRIEALI